MTVRIYRSSDASAPSLSGSVGSLIALLDACLVNGYGSQTAAGWTKAFSTTNKAAYKQNLTGANNSSGMYLYVDDTGPGAGGAREARTCGFETMSAITPTGTGQFPTSAQSLIGVGTLIIRKSTTADATTRAWTLVANGQTIYLSIETGDQVQPLGSMIFVFGDFKSYKASDQYAVCIIGRAVENQASAQYDPFQIVGGGVSGAFSLNSKTYGHFVARTWTAAGGSLQVSKTADWGKLGANVNGGWTNDATTNCNTVQTITSGRNNSSMPLMTPNGPDSALIVSPFYIAHNYALRGYLPGLWFLLHDRPFAHNDTLTVASGNLNGKSLVCQQFGADISGNATTEIGQVLIEYSDTWT